MASPTLPPPQVDNAAGQGRLCCFSRAWIHSKALYTLSENGTNDRPVFLRDSQQVGTEDRNNVRNLSYEKGFFVLLLAFFGHAKSFVSGISCMKIIPKRYTLNENHLFCSRTRKILEFVTSRIFVQKVEIGCRKS